MHGRTPQFGTLPAGTPCQERPGSYGIALREAGGPVRVLTVVTPEGVFLPGGGAEAGESAETTLRRELREELGLELTGLAPVGAANQYVVERATGLAFNKQERFYLVQLAGDATQPAESDHRVAWLPVEVALTRLREEAQRWALRQAPATKHGWRAGPS